MKRGMVRYAVVGDSSGAHLAAFSRARISKLAPANGGISAESPIDRVEECLRSGLIDAIFLAVPLFRRKQYVLQAAQAGVHVLCEKPMGLSVRDCEEMRAACGKIRFMTYNEQYFDATVLKQLGRLRVLEAFHSQPVRHSKFNALTLEQGGGPTFELGAAAINTVLGIFREEPLSVYAQTLSGKGRSFRGFEETMNVVLKFPGERLAVLTCSFGVAASNVLRLHGTKASLSIEPIKRDSLADQLDIFSGCILAGRNVPTSWPEAWAEVRIIDAIYASAMAEQPIVLTPHAGRGKADVILEAPLPRDVA